MSKLFTFKNANVAVQYDPVYHNIVIDGKHIYLEDQEQPEDRLNNPNHKTNKPFHIKIVMGSACNMKCKYCLQTALTDTKEKQVTNAEATLEWLSMLDLSNLNEIELWGGEPLLYWRYIQTLVSGLDFKGKINMVTNGTKLTVDHIKWMERTKPYWRLGISHDGPYHNLLRGENFLLDRKVRDALDYIETKAKNVKAGFSIVVGEHSWDVFRVAKYFQNYYPTFPLYYQLSSAYDEQSMKYVLNKNMDKYLDSVTKLVRACLDNTENFPINTYVDLLYGVKNIRDNFKNHFKNETRFHCGVTSEQAISVDAVGNLLSCHNAFTRDSNVYGTVRDITSGDISTVMDTSLDSKCAKCVVRRICQQGCPVTKRGSKEAQMNCNVDYHHYTHLLALAITDALGQTELMKLIYN